jgi:hypothetical protein
MTPREKMLAAAVGGVAGLLVLGWAGRAVMMKPVRDLDRKISTKREQVDKIKAERRAFFVAEDQMKAFMQRTFDENVDAASAKSGEMLTLLITQSGLREAEFVRLPVGPRKLRGASEIGWSVQGDGPLRSVVNLLFLLQESQHLCRIDSLSVTPADAPGQVKVRFRYLTLVLQPAPLVDAMELHPRFTLDSPERRTFEGIIARDLLRPYVKRPPAAVAGPASGAGGTAPGALPGPEVLKVADLSEWQGQQEVGVLNTGTAQMKRYRLGDELGGGVIVLVDKRPLPSQTRPGLRSDSRVILKIGPEYWAIELGRTVAEKFKLAPEQLPEQLSRL